MIIIAMIDKATSSCTKMDIVATLLRWMRQKSRISGVRLAGLASLTATKRPRRYSAQQQSRSDRGLALRACLRCR